MVEIEIEGEMREIDEEKVERLVKYEDAVIHNETDVATPNQLTAYETISNHLPSFLMTVYPKPVSGTVIDVDVNEPQNQITIEYKYRGTVKTERFNTESESFANLMDYWGLYPHQVMEIPGKKLPITEERYSPKIDIPKNTAYWATLVFKSTRWLHRLGFLDVKHSRRLQDKTSYELSTRGREWALISQFFVILAGFIAFLPPLPEESLIAFIVAIIIVCSGLGMLVGAIIASVRTCKFVMAQFSSFTKTESWPL